MGSFAGPVQTILLGLNMMARSFPRSRRQPRKRRHLDLSHLDFAADLVQSLTVLHFAARARHSLVGLCFRELVTKSARLGINFWPVLMGLMKLMGP